MAPTHSSPPASRGELDRSVGRLLVMLTHRDRVALVAAQVLAHDYPQWERFSTQLNWIEAHIEYWWPEVFESLLPTWVTFDAELLHSEETPHELCLICVAQNPPAASAA
jgi:hypothetical protein